MQFIPAFLILIYLTHRHTFRNLSHSILGKLFAVMLILYYTRMHFLFGTLCCFVVIIYYMLTENVEEGFRSDAVVETSTVDKLKTSEETVQFNTDHLILDKPKEVTGIITIDQFNDAKEEFIREKCKNGVLMYKDLPVKTEMADHVYSEIKFNKSNKCNPCDRTCDYNIVEAKLKTQEAMTPKRSRDM
jgi:Ca2+/Na+ antiporter